VCNHSEPASSTSELLQPVKLTSVTFKIWANSSSIRLLERFKHATMILTRHVYLVCICVFRPALLGTIKWK
jgi:hypothetical protein